MIIIVVGERVLADCEAVSVQMGRRSAATIRKHCTPVACHVGTRRLLFDVDEAVAALAKVPTRQRCS